MLEVLEVLEVLEISRPMLHLRREPTKQHLGTCLCGRVYSGPMAQAAAVLARIVQLCSDLPLQAKFRKPATEVLRS